MSPGLERMDGGMENDNDLEVVGFGLVKVLESVAHEGSCG